MAFRCLKAGSPLQICIFPSVFLQPPHILKMPEAVSHTCLQAFFHCISTSGKCLNALSSTCLQAFLYCISTSGKCLKAAVKVCLKAFSIPSSGCYQLVPSGISLLQLNILKVPEGISHTAFTHFMYYAFRHYFIPYIHL